MSQKQSVWDRIRSRLTPATKHDLQQLREQLMKTQAQHAEELRQHAANITVLTANVSGLTGLVHKIGTETETSKERIKALEEAINNDENVSEEVTAAFTAVQESFGALSTSVGEANTKATEVDEKIPDAAPPQA